MIELVTEPQAVTNTIRIPMDSRNSFDKLFNRNRHKITPFDFPGNTRIDDVVVLSDTPLDLYEKLPDVVVSGYTLLGLCPVEDLGEGYYRCAIDAYTIDRLLV